ncbi:hypothetical protein [Desulfobacterium sp. N47]|uniref:hypothetical protein n=1 Tax=Desulfobacterium sp. N47 TaxID=3115210 RepID=UPI003CAE7B9F
MAVKTGRIISMIIIFCNTFYSFFVYTAYGAINFTVGKYGLYLETSLVNKSIFNISACAPMKKSGNGAVFSPFFVFEESLSG